MAETIAQAVKQIKNTVSLRSLDESATKQGVALRLLSLAGWNPFDVSEVVPEYTVGNRRVDYALRPGSANAVFIEVKRPGENLERHQQQLLEYCFQEGVKLAAVNQWADLVALSALASGELGTETVLDHRPRIPRTRHRSTTVHGVPFSGKCDQRPGG